MNKLLLFTLLIAPIIGVCQTDLANWTLTENANFTSKDAKLTVTNPALNGLVAFTTPFNSASGMRFAPAEDGGSWQVPVTGFTLIETRYVDFSISPNTGYKVNVQKLIFNSSAQSSGGGRLGIKYSKNADFSSPSQVSHVKKPGADAYVASEGTFCSPVTLASATRVDNNDATTLWEFKLNEDIGKSIEAGGKLYIRLYYTVNLAATGRPILLRNLKVTGEVAEIGQNFANAKAEGLEDEYEYEDPCDALPVSLLSFTAKKDGSTVNLNWETASETNNSHFEISRASNNLNFQLLKSINGQGTSSKKQDYNFIDLSPENGNNYYKLTQVDLNGDRNELAIKNVYFGIDQNTVKIWPIPFNNELNIELGGKNKYLGIIDINGRVIDSFNTNPNSSAFRIQTSNYPSGIYLIKSEDTDGKQTVIKIIKN